MGPAGDSARIGPDFFHKLALNENCECLINPKPGGLVKDFAELRSDQFLSERVSTEVVKFYEETSGFEMDVWSEWCSVFRPFGWLLRFLFSYRLQQLNVPLSPLETSRGITSDVIHLVNKNDRQLRLVGWLRTMADSGNVIYMGFYSICTPPDYGKPCVKVVFPLPNGHATVLMRPEVCTDGSLRLHSEGEKFGDAGFYFVVRDKSGNVWAKYLRTMKECIHVYPDKKGLRTDHVLKVFGSVFLRLHYHISPHELVMNNPALS